MNFAQMEYRSTKAGASSLLAFFPRTVVFLTNDRPRQFYQVTGLSISSRPKPSVQSAAFILCC